MPSQQDIIGTHPIAPSIFEKWFNSTDHPPKATSCHRALNHLIAADDAEVIEWLARRIIDHHYKLHTIERLRNNYTALGFPQYAAQLRQIPVFDNTKKGNATEIILLEYIKDCQAGHQLVHTFRLRYNPNVDQAMKGDDVLIVDMFKNAAGNDDLNVFLGEAKFRSSPNNEVLADISSSLGKDKLPLSYSFLIERLYEEAQTVPFAEHLEKFLVSEIKASGNLRFVGMLLSNHRTNAFVEANFSSTNPEMVIISTGIDSPVNLINNAFVRAQELLDNPHNI